MKTAIDTVTGRIVDYDPYTGMMTIKAQYDDWFTMAKRDYNKCLIQLVDSRPLSNKQRKACYAMIHEIAEYTGDEIESAKKWCKKKFVEEEMQGTIAKSFSLSSAPMSLVCAFQKFLIDLILANGIPTRFPLIDMVDDIGSYVYSCLKNRVCCVCGRKADLHHVEAVGIGRNRGNIVHEGMMVMPLCRGHHTEAHTLGNRRFMQRYHLNEGIPLDKFLCKIYGLKINESIIEPEGEIVNE